MATATDFDGDWDRGFQISDFRSQTSNFRLQISDFRFQTSDFRFQISGRRHILVLGSVLFCGASVLFSGGFGFLSGGVGLRLGGFGIIPARLHGRVDLTPEGVGALVGVVVLARGFGQVALTADVGVLKIVRPGSNLAGARLRKRFQI